MCIMMRPVPFLVQCLESICVCLKKKKKGKKNHCITDRYTALLIPPEKKKKEKKKAGPDLIHSKPQAAQS